jgi:hypothetical protein
MKTSFRLLLILAVAVLSSACNASAPASTSDGQPSVQSPTPTSEPTTQDPAPANTGGIDACSLLSKADAESILGAPVKDAEHPIEGSEAFTVTSCVYHADIDSSSDKVSLIVSVSVNGDAQFVKTTFNSDKTSAMDMFGASSVDVLGVGDAAAWTGGSGNYLAVLKGDVFITLRVSKYQGDTAPQPVVELAKLVVSRLP